MCRKPNIVTTRKVRILESAGHLVRMPDDRTVKKVCQETQEDWNQSGQTILRMIWNRRVSRDGGRKQNKDLCGLSSWRWHSCTIRTVCQWRTRHKTSHYVNFHTYFFKRKRELQTGEPPSVATQQFRYKLVPLQAVRHVNMILFYHFSHLKPFWKPGRKIFRHPRPASR